MKLKHFSVEGLFGLFDHSIDFNSDERITILHAPNGYGKTVILKFISGFFGGSLAVFRNFEYSKVTFKTSDGGVVNITQSPVDPDLFPGERHQTRFYNIEYIKSGQSHEWNPLNNKNADLRREIAPSALERYVPHLNRVGTREWHDRTTGEVLHFYQAIERYSTFFPASVRHAAAHPEWLENLRNSIHCQLIETQRLMIQKAGSRTYEANESPLIPAVRTYAENLAVAMGKALADSATLSQSLDRTFPNRLLGRMRDHTHPLSEKELRYELGELERKRARLTKVDLLDKSEESALISDEEIDDATRKILSEYVGDAKRKLDVYDDILVRIELFTELLNGRFQFKEVHADRRKGFIFYDIKGRPLEVDSLSSGEQHELVLIYDLLFKTKKDTLLLIDEPEISLHIAWQKKFLGDLRKIIALTPMDVVLSTHSPQLIGADLNLAVMLKGPNDGKARVRRN